MWCFGLSSFDGLFVASGRTSVCRTARFEAHEEEPQLRRFLYSFGVLLFWAALLAMPGISAGQSEPQVPCVACPDLEFSPKPETGLWGNTLDPTGTGFMLEVQGDRLAGFLFIYDDTGQPDWFLLSGTLEAPPEGSEAIWVVESDLTRFSGGPCINCSSQPAMVTGSGGTVRFEFFARNFGRFRIGEGDYENITPLTFGVLTEAAFPELTDYRLPDLEGLWVMAFDDELPSRLPEELPRFDRAISEIVWLIRIPPADGSDTQAIRYEIRRTFPFVPLGSPPPPEVIGALECSGDISSGPQCIFSFESWVYSTIPTEFAAPLANVGHSRIMAEADGFVLQVLRLNQD